MITTLFRTVLTLLACVAFAGPLHAAETALPETRDLTTGLVLHYTFDVNATNTTSDDSGNRYDGIVSGGAAWTSNGQIAAGLELDGVDGFVGRADVVSGLAEGSVGLWFKPNSWTSAPVVRGLIASTVGTQFSEPGDGMTLGSHPVELDDMQIMFGIQYHPIVVRI